MKPSSQCNKSPIAAETHRVNQLILTLTDYAGPRGLKKIWKIVDRTRLLIRGLKKLENNLYHIRLHPPTPHGRTGAKQIMKEICGPQHNVLKEWACDFKGSSPGGDR